MVATTKVGKARVIKSSFAVLFSEEMVVQHCTGDVITSLMRLMIKLGQIVFVLIT